MKFKLAGLFESAAATPTPKPAEEIERARKLHQQGDQAQ
jgi:hypothetical protein